MLTGERAVYVCLYCECEWEAMPGEGDLYCAVGSNNEHFLVVIMLDGEEYDVDG